MAGIITAAEKQAGDNTGVLRDVRMEAARRFDERPMPTLEYGLGIETTLNFTWDDVDWDSTGTQVNVEDTEKVDVYTRENLGEAPKHIVEKGYSRIMEPRDKLTCLHYAVATPIILHIPAEQDGQVTIHVTATAPLSGVHILVVTERNSQLDVLEIQESHISGETGAPMITSVAAEIVAAEGSHVTYTVSQELGEDVHCFSTRRSRQGKDASVDWFDTHFGGKLVKSEVYSRLQGEGSDTKNMGLYMARGTQHMDLLNGVEHRAPHTAADLKARGVQKEESTSVYRGLIDIGRDAPHTTGFQKAATLLLSEEARNSSLPILEINNDEVETEHAAAATQLDEEKLFYMESRGIPQREARHLVVEGFFNPVTEHLPDYSKTHVEENIAERVQP